MKEIKRVNPKISVVMSVYNCEKYVGDTIYSVIQQTYEDWEFIIIDDNSSDRSAEVISSYKDARIRFIRNEINKGQSANLNYGIKLAKGEYIARLDHDDLCLPSRFEKQLKYMDDHPELIMCGTGNDTICDGEIVKMPRFEINSPNEMELLEALMFNHIAHSSFFIRKACIDEFDLQYGDYHYCEDYDFILSALKHGMIGFVEENLVLYRVFEEQTTATYPIELQREEDLRALCEYWKDSSFSMKDILIKACKGQLVTCNDYFKFNKAFTGFAAFLGLGNKPGEVIKNTKHAVELYFSLLRKQKRTILWYLHRLTTKYR